MRCTVLKRRVGEGRHRVRFVGVGTADDYDSRRKPLLWSFEGDTGILEVISGKRPRKARFAPSYFGS